MLLYIFSLLVSLIIFKISFTCSRTIHFDFSLRLFPFLRLVCKNLILHVYLLQVHSELSSVYLFWIFFLPTWRPATSGRHYCPWQAWEITCARLTGQKKTTSLVNFSTCSECGKATVPSIHSLWRFCWTDKEGVYFWFFKTVNWGKENGIKSNSVTCSERSDFCQRFSFPCNFRDKDNVRNWLTQHKPPLRDLFDVLIKSSEDVISFGAAGVKFTVRCHKENSNFSFSVCCITTVFKPLVLRSDLKCCKIKELSDTMRVL